MHCNFINHSGKNVGLFAFTLIHASIRFMTRDPPLRLCIVYLPLGEGDEENERYPRRQSEATPVKSKEVHNADVESSFLQFSLLPKEIRLHI
jgi:hypothetical protein